MFKILALGFAERSINRIIDLDAIMREQLNQLHGQSLRLMVDAPQISIDVYFDENKLRLEPTPKANIFEPRSEQMNLLPTTTLRVHHLVELFKLLLSREQEIGNIPVQGDYRLLMQLKQIVQHSEIDFASALTPYFGATIAYELGKMQHLPKMLWQQAQNQAYVVQDYLKEDSGLFAPRWQMDDLQHDTRQLNQDIDRLEAKIKKLQQQYVLLNHDR